MKFGYNLLFILFALSKPLEAAKLEEVPSHDKAVSGDDLLSESIIDKRGLNGSANPQCIKVKYIGGVQYGGVTGPDNWSANGTTLTSFCSSHNCCRGSQPCMGFAPQPDTTYEICENSCNGRLACAGVGKLSANGSTFTFEAGSCNYTGHRTDPWNCYLMAHENTNKLNLRVGEGSCTGNRSCHELAREESNLEELTIGSNSCINEFSCQQVARNAANMKTLTLGSNTCTESYSCQFAAMIAESSKVVIDDNQCDSSNSCKRCEQHSTLEAIQLTKECCAQGGTACQYSEPSDQPSSVPSSEPSGIPSDIPSDQPSSVPSSEPSGIPSDIPSDQPSSAPSSEPSDIPSDNASDQPSKQPSSFPSYIPTPQPTSACANQKCNNAGKCEVTSTTEFKCICENTFINTENGRSCVCPPGFIRKSDNRCYDPTTPSPTNEPTASPTTSKTLAPTFSPSGTIEDEIEGCNDDEDAKFFLIQNPNQSVDCSWLSKNKARANKRIAKYCDLHRVKTICNSTCSFCSCVDDDFFTFELTNVSDPNKKNKTCDWLTSNKKKRAVRIEKYCTENFDGGVVMNACTKTCGLCE